MPNSTTSEGAWVKPPLALKKRVLSLKQLNQPNTRLGANGEARAVAFLVAKRLEIVDQNVRVGNSEIDIIARDVKMDELVFIEVKTRSSADFGEPSAAVNWKKIKSLQTVARQYLKEHQVRKDYRFDIITLTPEGIEHFENVTWV